MNKVLVALLLPLVLSACVSEESDAKKDVQEIKELCAKAGGTLRIAYATSMWGSSLQIECTLPQFTTPD